MTANEYLEQAYRIDQRISCKVEQVSSLRNLATKATSTLSDAPPSGTRNVHRMEDVIVKIVAIENEINADIDRLVELKQEIIRVIKMVENPEYRILLELRYLCFKEWRDIADELGYSIRHIYRMREEALEKIIVPT
jgi:DNA-directed RNA polymerase specialized sigma subunit